MSLETLPFSEDQKDVLQEIHNIAMGRAGKSLAEAFGTFIHLSIPKIHILSPRQITEILANEIGHNTDISAVRQSFSGTLQGESIVIFNKQDYHTLSALLDHPGDLTPETENELLLDVSNILIGAFHSCIRDIMSIEITVAPPVLLAKSVEIERLTLADPKKGGQFVMIEIVFEMDNQGSCCHLAQLMPNSSIETLKTALDDFIAAC
jgi:chemotaxis protein CheC